MIEHITVSVIMISFNHDKFIKKAIEGVLIQECSFNIELIIAEDKSSDNTKSTIISFLNKRRVPNNIKIYYTSHNINKGPNKNYLWAFRAATGKYIANCEGDDYWTDPLKLQKQVDFLENNLDYGICFHRVLILEEKTNELIEDVITRKVKETTDIKELTNGNYIHTPTVMLRNDFDIPDWFGESPIGDWVLYMICIGNKKIKKMEEIMAVYRVYENGIWSLTPIKSRLSKTIESIELVLNNVRLTEDLTSALDKLSQEYKSQIIEIETTKQSFWKRLLN